MVNQLTDRMSWEEIAEYFADKLLKNGMIKNKEKFVNWFNTKEDIANGKLLFDHITYAYCYRVANELEKDNDYWTIILGKHGLGKSWLGAQIGAVVSPRFGNHAIIFHDDQYLREQKYMRPGDTIQLDEGVLFLDTKKHMTVEVTDTEQFLQLVRQDRVHHIVCVGELRRLVGYVRDFRRDSLIIIKSLKKYKIVYDRKGCDIISSLYPKIKRDINHIKLPQQYWVDAENRAVLPACVDWDEYRNSKKDNLERKRAVLLAKAEKRARSGANLTTMGSNSADQKDEGVLT